MVHTVVMAPVVSPLIIPTPLTVVVFNFVLAFDLIFLFTLYLVFAAAIIHAVAITVPIVIALPVPVTIPVSVTTAVFGTTATVRVLGCKVGQCQRGASHRKNGQPYKLPYCHLHSRISFFGTLLDSGQLCEARVLDDKRRGVIRR
jgi:hypothetical protein